MFKLIHLSNGEEPAIEFEGGIVPKHPLNRHYNKYLQWVAEGNTPEEVPVSLPDAAERRRQAKGSVQDQFEYMLEHGRDALKARNDQIDRDNPLPPQ